MNNKYKIIFYSGDIVDYLKDVDLQKVKILFFVKRKNQKQHELLNNILNKVQNVINDFDTIYKILVQFENEKEKKG